ncbi:MAG TPA: ABC transporter permease [Vicinamibacteria bacterium]|nr:ABC transporter permease [Vicinamibacteria bacterium]
MNAVAESRPVATGSKVEGAGTLRKIGYVALNTYRETVRDKVLYNLVLFALLMIGSSYVLGAISVYQEIKIIKDLGLAAISIFGMVIAIFIGIGLVAKEIDKRTLYGILPKPISRSQFLLGKYFGLCLTLLVNLMVMTVGLYVLLFLMKQPFEPALLKAIFLTYLELALLVAVAILFSTFTSSILSGLFAGFVYVAGYLSNDLKNLESVVESAFLPQVTRVLYYVLPNFKNFDVKAAVVAGDPVLWSQLGWATAYAAIYIALLLVASCWIFQKRNLK